MDFVRLSHSKHHWTWKLIVNVGSTELIDRHLVGTTVRRSYVVMPDFVPIRFLFLLLNDPIFTN